MASSGIRLGAWEYMKWGNIQPIEKEGEVVAAKIIVYAGEEDEYFSFSLLLSSIAVIHMTKSFKYTRDDSVDSLIFPVLRLRLEQDYMA